jgi:hypothetical protein
MRASRIRTIRARFEALYAPHNAPYIATLSENFVVTFFARFSFILLTYYEWRSIL